MGASCSWSDLVVVRDLHKQRRSDSWPCDERCLRSSVTYQQKHIMRHNFAVQGSGTSPLRWLQKTDLPAIPTRHCKVGSCPACTAQVLAVRHGRGSTCPQFGRLKNAVINQAHSVRR